MPLEPAHSILEDLHNLAGIRDDGSGSGWAVEFCRPGEGVIRQRLMSQSPGVDEEGLRAAHRRIQRLAAFAVDGDGHGLLLLVELVHPAFQCLHPICDGLLRSHELILQAE